jgi:hypothetical protein
MLLNYRDRGNGCFQHCIWPSRWLCFGVYLVTGTENPDISQQSQMKTLRVWVSSWVINLGCKHKCHHHVQAAYGTIFYRSKKNVKRSIYRFCCIAYRAFQITISDPSRFKMSSALGFLWAPLGSLGLPWAPLGSLGLPWAPRRSLELPGALLSFLGLS